MCWKFDCYTESRFVIEEITVIEYFFEKKKKNWNFLRFRKWHDQITCAHCLLMLIWFDHDILRKLNLIWESVRLDNIETVGFNRHFARWGLWHSPWFCVWIFKVRGTSLDFKCEDVIFGFCVSGNWLCLNLIELTWLSFLWNVRCEVLLPFLWFLWKFEQLLLCEPLWQLETLSWY